MPKNYKIKRYNHIYRGKRPLRARLLRWAATIAVVAAFAFIGWNAYGPIRDYFAGTLLAAPADDGSSPGAPEESAPVSSGQAPAEPEQPAAPALPAELHAVYLPVSILLDETRLDSMLDELSRTDTNAVLFDLKDTNGTVLYRSQLELVAQAEAQAQNPYDLGRLCEKLAEKNLVPIGRLNAFRDPTAANRIPEACVKYMNTDTTWLDNAPESGGKPWLNPYSELAQAYITDIAAESVSMGVRRVMLDNVSFPTGYGLELATYGPNASGKTRSDALAEFIDAADARVEALGGEVSVYITGLAALGANNTYYGSNPLALANENVTIGVMPAQFGDAFTLESFTLDAPVLDPGGTVDSLLKFIAPDLSGKQVTAMVQAYPADYTLTNNKMYTAEDIKAQIGAAASNNVGSYIIYHPDGAYPAL